ncbi:MAG: hypothetical protein K2J10_08720 [Muribaculaceae bacterium]|nr:hypothetical protein [Muribaculaceae bacterium]
MVFQQSKSFFDNQKQPVSLYQGVWLENTTALIHSPRSCDVDKTQMALSIAKEVADGGRDVLYISAEPLMGKNRTEAERLFIFTPEFESIDDERDYADLVFEAIDHAVRNTAIRTIVVDSVTRIAGLSFGRNASAAYIMKRLVALQVKCKLSLLVLADDTTKSAMRALGALASAVISLADTSDKSDKSDKSDLSDKSDKPVKTVKATTPPMPHRPFPVGRPTPKPVLTRQQRRALARQQAAKRKNFPC